MCREFGKGIWVGMTDAFLIGERRYSFCSINTKPPMAPFLLIPFFAFQARFPFLDEDVIRTLLEFPLWDIADLDRPVGIGDKKILREVCPAIGIYNSFNCCRFL